MRNTFLTKGYKLIAGSAIALSAMLAGTANAGTIVGSDHDLSTRGFTGEICVVCHTPHNSDTTVSDAPLWNHAITTQTFTMYTSANSATLDGAVDATPTGTSLLCLSCHDGVTALDSFGGSTGLQTIPIGTGAPGSHNRAVGGDTASLTNDHPISIVYDTVADTTLHPATNAVTIGSGTQTKDGTIASLMIDGNGKVQCTSCHDVHNGFTNDLYLLKIRRTNSDLCLTCHNK